MRYVAWPDTTITTININYMQKVHSVKKVLIEFDLSAPAISTNYAQIYQDGSITRCFDQHYFLKETTDSRTEGLAVTA